MKLKVISHLLLLLAALIWGLTFIAAKRLLIYFSPIEILMIRLMIAYSAIFLIKPKINPFRGIKIDGLIILAGFLGIFISQLSENIATLYTSATNISIIVAASPIITAILAAIIFKNKIKPIFFIGFIVTMAGIILLSLNGKRLDFNPVGDLIAIIAAITWGGYTVIIKLVDKHKIHPIEITRKVFFYSLVFISIASLFEKRTFEYKDFLVVENIIWFIFLGILGSGVAFFSWNYGVKQIKPISTAIYIYLIPVITFLAAPIFLDDENITLLGGLGLLITIIGIVISSLKLNKKESKEISLDSINDTLLNTNTCDSEGKQEPKENRPHEQET